MGLTAFSIHGVLGFISVMILRKLYTTNILLISQLPQMLPYNCLENLWENQEDLLEENPIRKAKHEIQGEGGCRACKMCPSPDMG